MEETKILVRFVHPHTHKGVHYPTGAQLEVTPALFEKLNRLKAIETVTVAMPGSADVDMAAAQAEAAKASEGFEASVGRGKRSRRGRSS